MRGGGCVYVRYEGMGKGMRAFGVGMTSERLTVVYLSLSVFVIKYLCNECILLNLICAYIDCLNVRCDDTEV
jgi:hypothetical protein